MKTLHFKKIKISKINNLSTILGGAQQQANTNQQLPQTALNCPSRDARVHTCDPGTNNGTLAGNVTGRPAAGIGV